MSFARDLARIKDAVDSDTAMAEVDGDLILGHLTGLEDAKLLRAELAAGKGVFQAPAPEMATKGERRKTGAKFAKP